MKFIFAGLAGESWNLVGFLMNDRVTDIALLDTFKLSIQIFLPNQ
jgi:hypothetical protein